MADKRRTTEDTVPPARSGESPTDTGLDPAPAGPAVTEPPTAGDAAAQQTAPAEPGRPRKVAKTTRSAKATKSTKAAKPAKAAKATTAKAAKSAPAKATKSAPTKATKAARRGGRSAAPAAPPEPVSPPEPGAAPALASPSEPVSPSALASPAEPAAAAPVPVAASSTPPAAPEPDVSWAAPSWTAAPGAWAAAAWEALQHIDQPPQALADLAVTELGPRAARWAAWLRQTYPGAPVHGLVRLATAHATRGGLALALAEAGGPVTAPLLLPAAAWVRATVVLRVAAAYGLDPTDSARAAELIELLDLDPDDAEQPLGFSGAARLATLAGATASAGRYGVVGFATRRLGLRRTPAAVLRALIAASEHTDQLRLLASRAAQYYRRAATVPA